MGALLGDAIGSHLDESKGKPKEKDIRSAFDLKGGGHWRLAPGQVTDEGELIVCLASALAADNQNLEAMFNEIGHYYYGWTQSNPVDGSRVPMWTPFATKDGQALQHIEQHGYASAFTAAAQHNAGNLRECGSLMRCIPLAIWGFKLPDKDLYSVVSRECALSHPHEACIFACASYCAAVAHLLQRPGDRRGALDRARAFLQEGSSVGKQAAEVLKWLELAVDHSKPLPRPYVNPKDRNKFTQGFVKIGYTHAFRHLSKGSSFDEAVKEVIAPGGYPGTNATIVGGLVGAAVGVAALDSGRLNAVVNCGQRNVEQVHPKNAQRLVEALVTKAPQYLG